MNTFTTIQRTGCESPNANGYFVQNANGATVAGPYGDRFEAWAAEDRLRAASCASQAKS